MDKQVPYPQGSPSVAPSASPSCVHLEKLRKHATDCLIAAACFTVMWLFARDHMALGTSALWQPLDRVAPGVVSIWPLYVVPVVIDLWYYGPAIRHRLPSDYRVAGALKQGTADIYPAAVFEELSFRWLWFLSLMPPIVFIDFVTNGSLRTVSERLVLPATDWLTAGYFGAYLLHPEWVVGVAALIATAAFTAGHRHPGRPWYIGASAMPSSLAFFSVTFSHGLAAAMAAHCLYNATDFVAVGSLHLLRPRPQLEPERPA